jgi:hypothetical protein
MTVSEGTQAIINGGLVRIIRDEPSSRSSTKDRRRPQGGIIRGANDWIAPHEHSQQPTEKHDADARDQR